MYCVMNALKFVWKNLELFFWVAAMVLLFFMEPSAGHFTLCPIKNLGFSFCPGCGIGHSIHYALHFNFSESFAHHPLGIFAIIIIFSRIIKLFSNLLNLKQYGYKTFNADTWG